MRIRSLLLIFGMAVLLPTLAAQAPSRDRVARLMEELTNAPGPSGFEGPVREILGREFRATGVEVSTDGLGSIIGVVRGTAESPRIMLAAHMDEVGLIVKYVMPDGFVKFQTLGGWLDQALAAQRWTIWTRKGPVQAVSGLRSPHITPSEDRTRVTAYADVFLDAGARSKEEAEALGIRPGDPITPWSPFEVVANNRYVGKAMDDRVGCAILVETLRRLKERGLKTPNTLYFVGTVQEEVGLRGARTVSEAVKPDLGIAVEAGIAADHPGGRPEMAQERLGAGPAIFLHDSLTLPNLKLRDFFLRVAAEKQIPLQTEVLTGAAMDSAEIQRYAAGTPAINLAVAARYLHSHQGMIDRADLDHAVDLLVEIVMRLDAKTVVDFTKF